MLFHSIQFLIFFPIVTLLYFAIPHRLRHVWLLVASYYFYMCWNPKYALLIAASTLITWVSGLALERANRLPGGAGGRRKKLCVALSFVSNLAILFFFKYFDFAVSNLNALLSLLHLRLLQPGFDVLLPVGISFYTFQALSYTMEVYRGEIGAEHNLLRYALFVSFFPQLVAGPIERSKNLLPQFREVHRFDFDRVKDGLLLMLWGFFMKLVIADRLGILVDQVYGNWRQYGGVELAAATVFFALQIYCDFGSYSNIAIGAAQVMGFRLMENFRQPYFAASVADFWRRWHISLTSWFRDYLYIPLGGNRKGRARKYCNVMLVFLTSGLWHGASWHFVAWGALNGLYQVIGDATKAFRQRILRIFRVRTDCASYQLFRILLTFVLVDLSWVFFRAENLGAAVQILGQMLTAFDPWALFDGTLLTLGLDGKDLAVVLAALLLLWIVDYAHSRGSVRTWLARQNLPFRWLIYYGLLFSLLLFGVYGLGYSAAAFLYFQF